MANTYIAPLIFNGHSFTNLSSSYAGLIVVLSCISDWIQKCYKTRKHLVNTSTQITLKHCCVKLVVIREAVRLIKMTTKNIASYIFSYFSYLTILGPIDLIYIENEIKQTYIEDHGTNYIHISKQQRYRAFKDLKTRFLCEAIYTTVLLSTNWLP